MLRRYRRQHDVTQQALAEALGYRAGSTVHRMERGSIDPEKYAEAIAEIVRISAERSAA